MAKVLVSMLGKEISVKDLAVKAGYKSHTSSTKRHLFNCPLDPSQAPHRSVQVIAFLSDRHFITGSKKTPPRTGTFLENNPAHAGLIAKRNTEY